MSRLQTGHVKVRTNLLQLCLIALAIPAFATALSAQQASSLDLEHRIDNMLSRLTLEQKIQLLGGVSTWYTHPEPSIGLASIRLSDGPAGLRSGIPAIAYPAPIALAATWDPTLAEQMGIALGHDARARGVDVLLGPGVDIARAPMGGRNFEYMGEDPWLASRIAVAYIEGVQAQGISATIKHYALNDEEYNRHNSNSDADERTLREIDLPAFEAAVKEARVGAIMDSYNLVNGSHSTQNGWLNNTVARHDWSFDGVIMSDWNSVYDGVAAVNNGLDLEMPFLHYMAADTLLPAVKDGRVSEATIDDHVRRILRLILRFNANGRPADDTVSLFSDASDQTALKVARESIVLLKNDGNLLPLNPQRICTLAVIGPNASPAVMGGGGLRHRNHLSLRQHPRRSCLFPSANPHAIELRAHRPLRLRPARSLRRLQRYPFRSRSHPAVVRHPRLHRSLERDHQARPERRPHHHGPHWLPPLQWPVHRAGRR
jgi:beta-glucosidase